MNNYNDVSREGLEDMLEEATEEIGILRKRMKEFKQVEANYDALQSPMPCGHLARYAVNGEDGTQYCCMCNSNALLDAGNKALVALEERNKLFEEACLFLAYQGYGVSADKFTDLPLDVQKYILGMFNLEVRP